MGCGWVAHCNIHLCTWFNRSRIILLGIPGWTSMQYIYYLLCEKLHLNQCHSYPWLCWPIFQLLNWEWDLFSEQIILWQERVSMLARPLVFIQLIRWSHDKTASILVQLDSVFYLFHRCATPAQEHSVIRIIMVILKDDVRPLCKCWGSRHISGCLG